MSLHIYITLASWSLSKFSTTLFGDYMMCTEMYERRENVHQTCAQWQHPVKSRLVNEGIKLRTTTFR